ncbi:MAG: PEP-CTERM sorting domain-containing protein [bacterium]|nr:PEP-CTERM sorting domain-containing protein [bacterium]
MMVRQGWLLLIAACLIGWATPSAALDLNLSPANQGGYGDQGLYLGNSNWGGQTSQYHNFNWINAGLSIGADGNATIRAEMLRSYDVNTYSNPKTWIADITLNDIVFKGAANDINDLAGSMPDGSGVEWESMTLVLTPPSDLQYTTNVPQTGWIGLAMPNMGHENVAEALFEDGILKVDFWVQNPTSTNRHYKVGDSKSHADPVPEPSSIAAFALGSMIVLFFIARPREE